MKKHIFLVSTLIFMGNIYAAETAVTVEPVAIVETPETTIIAEENPDFIKISSTLLEGDAITQPYAYYQYDKENTKKHTGRTKLDKINYTPGIFIQHTAPGQTSPFIRGLTGRRSLLLVDGVRLSHAVMRDGPNQYAAMVPDISIEKTDVILGGASSVHGSDALTGTIDLRLADAGRGIQETFSPWVYNSVDYANGMQIAAGFDGKYKDFRYSIEASRSDFHDRIGGKDMHDHLYNEDEHSDYIPNSAYKENSWGTRIAYDGLEKNKFELKAGQKIISDAPRPDGYLENSGKDSRISRLYEKQDFSYAHLNHKLTMDNNDFDDVRTILWWHKHHEKQNREDIKDYGDVAEERYRQRITDDSFYAMGIQSSSRVYLSESNELSFGLSALFEETKNDYAEYRSDKGDTTDGAKAVYNEADWEESLTVPDGSKYNSYAIFAQNEFDLNEKINILSGLRYSLFTWDTKDGDDKKATGNTQDITGALRVSYRLDEANMFYSGISKAFRAPNLKDLVGKDERGSNDEFAKGSLDLKPEISYNFELGWKHEKEKNILQVSTFYTMLEDLMQKVYEGSDFYFTNAESGYMYGIEGQWDYEIPLDIKGRLAVIGSVNFVKAKVDMPQDDGSVEEEFITRANRFYGQIGLNYDYNNNEFVKTIFRIHEDYKDVSPADAKDVRLTMTSDDKDGTVDGYVVWDIGYGWTNDEKTKEISLDIENILDKTYREIASAVDASGRNIKLTTMFRF